MNLTQPTNPTPKTLTQLQTIYKTCSDNTLRKMLEYDRGLTSLLYAQEQFLRIQQELRLFDLAELTALLELQREELKNK
jgi:hypothetical protein